MSELAALLHRLDAAIGKAVVSGKIGIARSLRLHIGGPGTGLPDPGELLPLGDAIFGCPRAREVRSGSARLCVWEGGQVATISSAPAPRIIVVLAVFGSGGALHLCEQSP